MLTTSLKTESAPASRLPVASAMMRIESKLHNKTFLYEMVLLFNNRFDGDNPGCIALLHV